MKTIIIYMGLILSLSLISCNDWIDPELNVDPSNPKDVPLSVMLPTTQAGIGYVLGGDMSRYASLITQHYESDERQLNDFYNYRFKEDDINNAWQTMYVGPMMDLYIMMKKADDPKKLSPHYKGVAQILISISLGMFTDFIGDIPYSESFQGDKILHPKFDSQEQIYNTIQSLLDDAIINLNAANSVFTLDASDLIYNGNNAGWIKAAFTLKARYFLHLKKYSEAINALTNGFSANEDDMDMLFGTTDADGNPLWDFISERAGYIRVNQLFIDMLTKGFNDPRFTSFVDTTDGKNDPGTLLASINSLVPIISFAEAKFIEAECQLGLNNQASAYTAYIAGITASLNDAGFTGNTIDNYIAQPTVGVGQANLNLEAIINQKYIALYTQSDTWTDWRRTGFPKLTPVDGPSIPRRVFYPQNAKSYNGDQLNKVPDFKDGGTLPNFIFKKLWWDRTFWNP